MYKVIWIYKRTDTSVPFFYESAVSTSYKAALTKLETSPTSNVSDRQVIATDQAYLDQVTFSSKAGYQAWLTEFLTETPNGLIERNKYLLDNDQELLVKVIDETGSTTVKRVVPFVPVSA